LLLRQPLSRLEGFIKNRTRDLFNDQKTRLLGFFFIIPIDLCLSRAITTAEGACSELKASNQKHLIGSETQR
jgi:hypothetical protein